MSENEQSIDSSAQVAAPVVESESQSAPTGEGQTSAPAAEKMIPQSQVSKIAAREAREAAERATERTRAEMRQHYESQQQQQVQQPPQSIGGMQQQSPEQIRQMIQEEAYKMSQQSIAQQIESDWLSAMNAEKDNDPEFAGLYDALNIEAHPDLILWMNGMENKAAIVKDIAKNPAKFSSILMLARSGSPQLAKMELNRLSASIKANEVAQKQAQVDPPLTQISPSNIGSDNGDMSVKDFMLIFKG